MPLRNESKQLREFFFQSTLTVFFKEKWKKDMGSDEMFGVMYPYVSKIFT